MDYQVILNRVSGKYQKILNDNLVGLYVHGSIALNCFNWDKSDIDLVVVVNNKLSQTTKLRLMEATVEINADAPPKGIEMSVVLKSNCSKFQYPTPFELHFSNMHINWYKSNADDYCKKMNGVDNDLAAHFTIIKKAGIVLCGQPIDEVFSDVPTRYYLDSIRLDIEEARSDIIENPMYIILNLCRVVAYVEDELILSKEQGGKWALEHLEGKYYNIIKRALHSYRSSEKMVIEPNEGEEYCDYMLKLIF